MIKFRMDNIRVPQFAIIKETPDNDLYSVNTSISFKVSEETRHIACICKFDFLDESDTMLFTGEIMCEFAIFPKDWDEKIIKYDKIVVPRELLEFLAVHTVGTSRGILYCKSEGTPYASYIIPPLNLRAIITEDAEFDKDT